MYSAPALCILYDSFFGLSYLYWASFCILHLHPASVLVSQLYVALGSLMHSASCICILHRVQFTALGPIHCKGKERGNAPKI